MGKHPIQLPVRERGTSPYKTNLVGKVKTSEKKKKTKNHRTKLRTIL